jgi:hypothetical protein
MAIRADLLPGYFFRFHPLQTFTEVQRIYDGELTHALKVSKRFSKPSVLEGIKASRKVRFPPK